MKHTGLLVWQKAIKLVKQIYLCTDHFPDKERYGLATQIQRAAVSVPSNIAEGAGQLSAPAYIRYLSIARGSLAEVETQIFIATELGYLSNEKRYELEQLAQDVGRLLNGVIRALKLKQVK